MAINPIIAPDVSGQRGFYNKYPYTDFHELNLDWLLTNYQSIIDKTNQIIEWANNHQIEYEEAIERLSAVENEIATFEAQITAAFNQLKADLEADFAQQKADLEKALADMKAEVDATVEQLEEDVAAAIAAFENRFLELETEIRNELAETKAQVARAIIELQNVLQANNQFIFEYVENRLQKFIDDLPEILTVMVYNPYRGEVTDIQTAINDIYSIACIWGLTATQYDSLGLTASEYDALELSAQEYDTLGYKLLYKDPNYYMLDPFTGEEKHIKDVIYELAALHQIPLTAEEYDNKELTAEYYDGLEITAYDYDWQGSALVA